MIPYLYPADTVGILTQSGYLKSGAKALGNAISCEISEELNGEFALSMVYPTDRMDRLVSGGAQGVLDSIIAAKINKTTLGGWEPFRVYQCDRHDGVYEIQAHHVTYDLEYFPVCYIAASIMSVNSIISYISSLSGWSTLGFTLTNSYNKTFSDPILIEPMSVRQAISEFFINKQYGETEMTPSGWTMAFAQKRGSDSGIRLVDGVDTNVTSVKVNNEQQYNGVMPYMNVPNLGGEIPYAIETITASGAASRVNKAIARCFDDDIDHSGQERTETVLRSMATNWINANYQNSTVSIELTSSKYISRDNIGDTFTIIAPRQKLASYSGRLVKLTYDVLRERPNGAYFDSIRLGAGDVIWTR